MVGVFAEADVGNHKKILSNDVLEGANRGRDNPVVAHRVASNSVFCLWNSKEHDAADPEFLKFYDFFDEFVERELKLAGHCGDRLTDAFAGTNEKGNDEAVGRKYRVPRKSADARMIAQSSESRSWEETVVLIFK